MRHRKTVRKLNRTAEHRKALLANLAGALFEHKRIVTTHAKAKAAQQFVEKLITLAKANSLHARRLVLSRVRHRSVMQTLFDEIAPIYLERNGGYTRVVRMGQRPGDGAEVSVLELVGFEEALSERARKKQEKAEAKEKDKKEKAEAVAAEQAPEPEVEEEVVEVEETEEETKEEK
jgi:large subunit ribosomal protein L17